MTIEQKPWRSISARSEEKAFSFLVFTHNLFVSVTKHFTRFHRWKKTQWNYHIVWLFESLGIPKSFEWIFFQALQQVSH